VALNLPPFKVPIRPADSLGSAGAGPRQGM